MHGTLNPEHDDDRLKGWKEIALFLHTSDRTVQRWESSLRLPVRRIETTRSAIVYASRRDLEAWLRSIEGRTAQSEQPGTGPAPVAAQESTQCGAPMSPDAAVTSDTPDGLPAMAPPIEDRVLAWRHFLWPVVALGVLALVGGIVPLANSIGRGWSTREKPLTSPKQAASVDALAPPARAARRTPTLPVRLTFENGSTAVVGIPVGGTATCAVAGRATYALSAELLEGGARIHVSWFEGRDPQGTPRLSELAVTTLRPGEHVPLIEIPGLATMEWTRAGSSGRIPAATPPRPR